jgi:hypothetical protein
MRTHKVLLACVASVMLILVVADPAAAVTLEQKLSVMNSWSQANATSYNAWNAARQNQGAWADYGFDWSTDFCSSSPDQPLGFDFRASTSGCRASATISATPTTGRWASSRRTRHASTMRSTTIYAPSAGGTTSSSARPA